MNKKPVNTLLDTPNTSKVFDDVEDGLIKKSLMIREQLVDKYVENGITNDNRDARVINELLNGMDSLVLGRADRRLKADANQNNGDVLELVKNIFLSSGNHKDKNGITSNPEVALEIEATDVVPGEDKIEYEELDLEDFRKIEEG